MKIAFLHTAQVHVETFDTLVKAISPDVVCEHHVAPELLARAQRDGLPSVEVETRKHLVELSQADAVLCTCSTLGPIADLIGKEHHNVTRVDRPLMEAACTYGKTPMVAICLESTRDATLELLHDCAAQSGIKVTPNLVLCDTAWPFFENGDIDGYGRQIAATIRKAVEQSGTTDCIVLAQASMRIATAELSELGIPVLSSPQLAAERILHIAQSASVASSQ